MVPGHNHCVDLNFVAVPTITLTGILTHLNGATADGKTVALPTNQVAPGSPRSVHTDSNGVYSIDNVLADGNTYPITVREGGNFAGKWFFTAPHASQVIDGSVALPVTFDINPVPPRSGHAR